MAQPLRMLPVALLLLWAVPAAAEITNCTAITSLPYTITSPGIYCLTGDLSTSMTAGNAITINASSVTLDLNGHKLGGLGAGPATTATGIYAVDRKNLTIRNDSIGGFYFGVDLEDSGSNASSGHLIEQLRLDGNTATAIHVYGAGSLIQGIQVVSTGGSTYFASTPGLGINAKGGGIRVLENDVTDTFGMGSTAPSYSVHLYSASGAVVRGNRLSNTARNIWGASYGIFVQSSTDVFVADNTIENTTYGVYFNNSTGKYRDNLTSAVDTPYSGGTDAGNNH